MVTLLKIATFPPLYILNLFTFIFSITVTSFTVITPITVISLFLKMCTCLFPPLLLPDPEYRLNEGQKILFCLLLYL